jgi:DHA2 family multidrug resistance protein
VVLFATLALLPPMLQNQMNYPVVLTGLVTAPRGIGTLVGMMVVGRLVTRFDARLIMAIGLLLTAYSLWEMTQFSLLMNSWPIIISGVAQGLGVGLVYVPLSTVAFTTLPAMLRNEGTAFFNLLRNVGSSIGISVVEFLLTQNTQKLHASLAENITPYTAAGSRALASAHLSVGSTRGLEAINGVITNQATMIAYIDDFQLMMILTLATIPFLFIIKKARPVAGSHVVLE